MNSSSTRRGDCRLRSHDPRRETLEYVFENLRAPSGEAAFLCMPDVPGGTLSPLFLEACKRHPALGALRYCAGLTQDKLPASKVDLVVFTCAAPRRLELLADAVCNRIPILVPDTWHGNWVRDGITGFHYCTDDPDSLAMSLLGFANLAPSELQRIVTRAFSVWTLMMPPLSFPACR